MFVGISEEEERGNNVGDVVRKAASLQHTIMWKTMKRTSERPLPCNHIRVVEGVFGCPVHDQWRKGMETENMMYEDGQRERNNQRGSWGRYRSWISEGWRLVTPYVLYNTFLKSIYRNKLS
ncbi:hypothetical protein O6H91_Y489500 [Diphasiastrum complanatum]|nr:hypothetical protein O6H91_Y489500 [Diphasiastrum complanatum]